jgi:hypothetical protein
VIDREYGADGIRAGPQEPPHRNRRAISRGTADGIGPFVDLGPSAIAARDRGVVI